jgi:uncharacterized protein YjbI with pentapeptide repeats
MPEELRTQTKDAPLPSSPAGEGKAWTLGAESADNDSRRGTDEDKIPLFELAEILDQHREWAESGGESGRRADLCGANLEDADLTGANLQGAFLHKANLRGADLSMANLQGASLVQADLQEANLLGAELRGANLMGAMLLGASGLWIGRMGRTNLFGAVLPDDAFDIDGTKAVAQATHAARWFYLSLLGIAAIFLFMLVATTDLHLLVNSSALPLPLLGSLLPMSGFYLGGPLLLTGLYLRFHFLLLRLWGNVAALPAVFPNGQTLEQSGSWFLMRLARGSFQSAKETRSPLFRVERVASAILAYWVVPAILFFFWARYLTRQDLRGTLLHVFLVTTSVAAAICIPVIVARVLRPGEFQLRSPANLIRIVTSAVTFSAVLGCVLSLVSIGVIRGVPQDSRRAPDLSPADIRRWAAEALWLVGYTPYADLNEAEISARTSAISAGEESLAQAPGAQLNQVSLRYAQAYRAFLVNAKLWKADLEGAYLSEADLRGVNLREARLHWATLDRVRASRAALVGADGRSANFAVADLRGADLSFAVLEDAIFAQSNLAGATLYGANLRRARLLRANLEKADLRDTLLEGAVLSLAVLHEADLSSAKLSGARLTGAQFRGTILLEADLRKTELHGAVFQGAVVREAQFDGANADGADFRGVLGLTAAQVCSAANWRGAQMDEALQQEVFNRCGSQR